VTLLWSSESVAALAKAQTQLAVELGNPLIHQQIWLWRTGPSMGSYPAHKKTE
jgi:hypothetical protein